MTELQTQAEPLKETQEWPWTSQSEDAEYDLDAPLRTKGTSSKHAQLPTFPSNGSSFSRAQPREISAFQRRERGGEVKSHKVPVPDAKTPHQVVNDRARETVLLIPKRGLQMEDLFPRRRCLPRNANNKRMAGSVGSTLVEEIAPDELLSHEGTGGHHVPIKSSGSLRS